MTKAQLLEKLDDFEQLDEENNPASVFRLSDTIDKKFIEDCLAPVSFSKPSPESTKMPLKKFLNEIEGNEVIDINIKKRQKTTEAA